MQKRLSRTWNFTALNRNAVQFHMRSNWLYKAGQLICNSIEKCIADYIVFYLTNGWDDLRQKRLRPNFFMLAFNAEYIRMLPLFLRCDMQYCCWLCAFWYAIMLCVFVLSLCKHRYGHNCVMFNMLSNEHRNKMVFTKLWHFPINQQLQQAEYALVGRFFRFSRRKIYRNPWTRLLFYADVSFNVINLTKSINEHDTQRCNPPPPPSLFHTFSLSLSSSYVYTGLELVISRLQNPQFKATGLCTMCDCSVL